MCLFSTFSECFEQQTYVGAAVFNTYHARVVLPYFTIQPYVAVLKCVFWVSEIISNGIMEETCEITCAKAYKWRHPIMKIRRRLLDQVLITRSRRTTKKIFQLVPVAPRANFVQPRDVMVGVSANRTCRSVFYRNLVEQMQK